MLANILALAVGLSSFALYMAAFFFPEVHRKSDFLWSGVGLFYALVLWFCARQITGAVLLGQFACVALLGWLGWQMVTLRRSLTPTDLQTPISVESFNQSTTQTFAQIKTKLRDGSWLKAIPTLALNLRELFQTGFSDSSENRLSRLARSRPVSKRKLKRRYEYEFVEHTPRDRRVQATVSPSYKKEPSDEAILRTESMGVAEAQTAPASKLDAAICTNPGKHNCNKAVEETEAKDISGEPIGSKPAAFFSGPTLASVEPSNIEAPESIPDIPSRMAQSPPSAPISPEKSTPRFPNPLMEKAIIIRDWTRELIASLTQPKPKYSMIELPPRPPSIPKPTAELREGAKDEEDEFEADLEELDVIEKPEAGLDESLSEDADDFENAKAGSEEISDIDSGIEAEAVETLMIVDSDRMLEADVDMELSGDSTVDETGDASKEPTSA